VRIDIVVYDGVDELDALGPLEVLRSAVAAGASISVRLVTRIAQESVTSSLDLALWLVERFAGRDLADTVARRMEYASARPELAGR
jgi:putative intracellular protease/amidase